MLQSHTHTHTHQPAQCFLLLVQEEIISLEIDTKYISTRADRRRKIDSRAVEALFGSTVVIYQVYVTSCWDIVYRRRIYHSALTCL